MVNVVLGENLGEGARMDSRCYWDQESDGSAQAFFTNVGCQLIHIPMYPCDTMNMACYVIHVSVLTRFSLSSRTFRTRCGVPLWRTLYFTISKSYRAGNKQYTRTNITAITWKRNNAALTEPCRYLLRPSWEQRHWLAGEQELLGYHEMLEEKKYEPGRRAE